MGGREFLFSFKFFLIFFYINEPKPEIMEIKLTNQESEKLFHNSLCNGLNEIGMYGIEVGYSDKDYKAAQKSLKDKIEKKDYPHEMSVYKDEKPTICYEDVLMEILRNGKPLEVIDHDNGEGTKKIFLKDVYENISLTPAKHLLDAVNENDDAITADCILQSVFFKDIIFS